MRVAPSGGLERHDGIGGIQWTTSTTQARQTTDQPCECSHMPREREREERERGRPVGMPCTASINLPPPPPPPPPPRRMVALVVLLGAIIQCSRRRGAASAVVSPSLLHRDLKASLPRLRGIPKPKARKRADAQRAERCPASWRAPMSARPGHAAARGWVAGSNWLNGNGSAGRWVVGGRHGICTFRLRCPVPTRQLCLWPSPAGAAQGKNKKRVRCEL
jgi:hypothetical protein